MSPANESSEESCRAVNGYGGTESGGFVRAVGDDLYTFLITPDDRPAR